MFGGKLLREVRVVCLDGLHDAVVLLIGRNRTLRRGEGLPPDPHDVLMIIDEQMLQHLGIAGFVQDPVELVVQLRHLLHVALFRMKLGEIDILLHLVHLFLRDMFAGPAGAQALQPGADHIDVMDILRLDTGDKGSAVRNDLNQAFQLQLTECLTDRRSRNSHLLPDRDFLQLLVFLIFAIQDVVADLVKHSPAERILVAHIPFYIICIHLYPSMYSFLSLAR